LRDRPTASITGESAVYRDAQGNPLMLSDAQRGTLESAFTIAADPTNTNNGAVDWTYQIADSALDFLAKDETVTLTFTVTLNDHNGSKTDATVTVTLTGTDDAVVIAAGEASQSGAITEADLTTGDQTTIHQQSGTIHLTDP